MTDLQTAEEIVEDLEEHDLSPRVGLVSDPDANSPMMINWRKDMAHAVRDIQRNFGEAAAKAVCWYCHEGVPIFKDGGYRRHGKDEYSAFGTCEAANIVKMLEALDPAPAGNETDGR